MKGFCFTRMFTSVSPFGSCAVKVPKHAAWQRKSREEAVTRPGSRTETGVSRGEQLPTLLGPWLGRGPQPDLPRHPSVKLLGPLQVPVLPGQVTLGAFK